MATGDEAVCRARHCIGRVRRRMHQTPSRCIRALLRLGRVGAWEIHGDEATAHITTLEFHILIVNLSRR